MIAELIRTTFKPSTFDDYLAAHGEAAFTLARRHLPLVAAFRSGSGTAHALVELALYEDYQRRDDALTALRDDADWARFRREHGANADHQETTILNPIVFSPLTDLAGFEAAIADAAGRAPMLFELRTYTARPGQMPTVLHMLKEEGNPLTHQFVEWPVAYFTAETGLSNRVMMLWAYSSAAERARRKSRMLPDPRFQELGSRFNPNFAEQCSEFLIPTAYSPLR